MAKVKNLHLIEVKVVRTDESSHEFIVEYDDRFYRVPQQPFQREREQPQVLKCYVEETPQGGRHLRQDLESLIRKFYTEGDDAEFRIQRAIGNYYIVEESHGFTAKIPHDLIPNPALTPHLKCRIERMNAYGMKVELVEKRQLSEKGFSITDAQLASYIGDMPWNTPSLRSLLLTSNISADVFDTECHNWLDSMTKASTDKEEDDLMDDLDNLCDRLLFALEDSPMLNQCKASERELIEQRFTTMIEQASYYRCAANLIRKGKAEERIEKVLHTLDTCCYLYHPTKNFYILTCIFQLQFPFFEKYMPQMLDILRRHDASLWKRKPFRELWIKLIDYYVQQLYAKPDQLAADNVHVRTMILALTQELSLADNAPNALFDVTLIRSMLYRLCSRMNVYQPQRLLEEALYTLIQGADAAPVYTLGGDDAEMTANMINNQVADVLGPESNSVGYTTDKARLLVKDGRISLSANGVTRDNVYTPMFTRLNLWHGLVIRLAEKPAADIRGSNDNTIPHYKQLWDFIYKSFFSGTHDQALKEKKRLLDGEEVSIIVRKKLSDGLLFECEVIDEGKEGIRGTLDAQNDVVAYYPGRLTVADFEMNGYPLVLSAITRVNDDGTYNFTMKDFVEDFMEEYRLDHLNFNSHMTVQLNTAGQGARRLPGISMEGLSVSVGVDPEGDWSVLQPNKVIEVYRPQEGPRPYTNATYLRDMPEVKFSVSEAFHTLMKNYAYEEVYTDVEEQEDDTDVETIDTLYVAELMNIIEAYASTESDYMKAYNDISFCRMMAHMIASDREEYYVRRLQLIELLNDFAVNNRFTTESLEKLQGVEASSFSEDSALYAEFRRMQVVSWLNDDAHYQELYTLSMNQTDSKLQQLASLVLSHNLVKKSGLAEQADSILNKIRSLLELKTNDTTKKYYGKESFTTEFKTSLVYPENTMRANMAQQTQKVLAEICAFLNAEGGTLYLGVNDQGYEAGLDEDLKYTYFKGNTDHYEDYLHNQIAMRLSMEADHHVHTRWDDEAEKDVLVVEIAPCPNPISLDGKYYERMGKSCRMVNDDYKQAFLDNRRQWALEHRLSAAPDEPEDSAPAMAPAAPHTAPAKTAEEDRVKTSLFRNNTIHEYEPDYIPTVAYICFMGDDEYKVIENDDYQTEDYRLELAVHDDETHAWLVLVYADGHVVKTSVSELLGREKGRPFKRYSGQKLVFASIAGDDHDLLLGYVDGKGGKRMRFDEISKIAETRSMQDYGVTLCDVSNNGLHYVEVMAQKDVPSWVTPNPKRTDLGTVLRTVHGREIAAMLPGCEV